jgi:hypothetical protein
MINVSLKRNYRFGLLIAAVVGLGVLVLSWLLTLMVPSIDVSSLWWWLEYPLMLLASWILGHYFPHRAWRLGTVMMAVNFVATLMFVPGAGNLLPIATIIYCLMTIPCALLAHSAAKDAGKPETSTTT